MLPYLAAAIGLIIAIAFVKQATLMTVFHVSHRLSGKPHIGIWFYSLFFFPGTVVHELAHYLTAILLGVHASNFTLFPKQNGAYLTLGSVAVAKSDPFRGMLIAAAPFFVGISAT